MIFINYHLACPKCFKGTTNKHTIGVNKGDKNKYLELTDFEVVKIIENWRKEDGHSCPVCGFLDMIALSPDVNGEPVYNYEQLVKKCDNMEDWDYDGIFLFVMTRTLNKIDTNINGKDPFFHGNWFLTEALKQIIATVEKQADNVYTRNESIADFFICLTGGYDFEFNRMVIRVEKISNLGFTKNEIRSEVAAFASKFNFDLS